MRWITPNRITVLRVFLAGIAVVAYASGSQRSALAIGCAGVSLTVAAIALDGLDGFVARRRNLATPLGAQLDILGDRVIENLFFIFFAACGEISFWIPVIFFARGALTDFLRRVASERAEAHAHSAESFRHNWLLTHRWSVRIVAGRASRGAYAALKCVCFCALGIEWTLQHAALPVSSGLFTAARATTNFAALAAMIFCAVRALPVAIEGFRDFAAKPAAVASISSRKSQKTLNAIARPATANR
jgi:CDP-diacylglycerol---glycerol-3-phosphate 3-phosphatidyltransferase